jgi:hypothetical protein
MLKASIANSQYGLGTPSGTIWPVDEQAAWICDKDREHYELTKDE